MYKEINSSKIIYSLIFFSLIFLSQLISQSNVIYLNNHSFESTDGSLTFITGWQDCGYKNNTPPTIFPDTCYNISTKPNDREKFIGLVVRDNGTTERIGQKLETPILSNQCYTFKINLCHTKGLMSSSSINNQCLSFANPTKLLIWGADKMGIRKEKLAESEPVQNTNWMEYIFRFQSRENYNYILLEAYYISNEIKPYNGIILLDNISPIVPLNCQLAINDSNKKMMELISDYTFDKKKVYKEVLSENLEKEDAPNFYFNSKMGKEEKILFFEKMENYLSANNFDKPLIMIKEKTHKKAKKSSKLVTKNIVELGYSEKSFHILEFVLYSGNYYYFENHPTFN